MAEECSDRILPPDAESSACARGLQKLGARRGCGIRRDLVRHDGALAGDEVAGGRTLAARHAAHIAKEGRGVPSALRVGRAVEVPTANRRGIAHQQPAPACVHPFRELPDAHVLRHPLAAIVRLQEQQHVLARREVRRPGHHVADTIDDASELDDVDLGAGVALDDLVHLDGRDRLDPAARSPLSVRCSDGAGDYRTRCGDERGVIGDEKRGGAERAGGEPEREECDAAHMRLYLTMVYTIHHPALMTPVTLPLIFDRPTRFRYLTGTSTTRAPSCRARICISTAPPYRRSRIPIRSRAPRRLARNRPRAR